MKKKYSCLSWSLYIAMALCIFTDCKDNDIARIEPVESSIAEEGDLSLTMALIEQFRIDVSNGIRTKGGNPGVNTRSNNPLHELTVKSVESKTLGLDVPSNILQTRSNALELEDGQINVTLETIVFELDGNEGFAIACSDPRVNRVYAYTEKGSISDTTFNVGLAATLFDIPKIVEKDVENYYTKEPEITTRSGAYTTVTYGPYLQTAWNQTAPYNNNLATCTSGGSGGHVYTGCTTTAVAQVVAYYNFPATYSSLYNLGTLRTLYNIGSSHSQVDNVAELMRVVGLGIQANFGCTSTGATMANAHSFLSGLGYYNLTRANDANINLTTLYQNLRDGNVHLTSGFTKNPRVGHAWVWDGFYGVANGTNVSTVNSIHCNWGWGGSCNGWYSQNLMETPNNNNHGTYLDDNVQLYINMY
ncbi:MAG: C10 family peptidase [Prevotellaceae bacterium]|jgi:hypothetical protein|nr:C10 family peptidase [Prevotellaceae bacterium]